MFDLTTNLGNVIFLDIDDTIADTRSAVALLYKEVTGEEPLNIREVKEKAYASFCPRWSEEDINKIFRAGCTIYNNILPIDGAIDGVNCLLDRGFDVRIVSMHTAEGLVSKQSWIDKYIPRLSDRVCYVSLGNYNKDIFKGYAIIDDDLKNTSTNQSQKRILFDFYDIYDKKITPNSIVCKNWDSVLDKI